MEVLDRLSSNGVYEPAFCLWTDLSYADCEKLLVRTLSPDDIKAALTNMFLKNDVAMETGSHQAEIAAELYAHGVVFARNSRYSPVQLSTLISVLKRVHEACISTPFDNREKTLKLVEDLMVKHCVERPPYSSSVFSLAQVKDITDYLLSTYFKHFKFYKFAFTKRIRLDLHFTGDESSSSTGIEEKPLSSEEGGSFDHAHLYLSICLFCSG